MLKIAVILLSLFTVCTAQAASHGTCPPAPGFPSNVCPDVDLNFVANTAWSKQGGFVSFASQIAITRASSGTDLVAADVAGASYNTYGNNVLRIRPGAGLLVEELRTNVLLNSTAPATQTTGSLANAKYQLWVNGSGSAKMSSGTATGCGTGTATNGSPVSFTTTGAAGTCTVTVTGSLNSFQLEAGQYPTSLIVTAGAAATRQADITLWTVPFWLNLTTATVYVEALWPPFDATNENVLLEGYSDNGGGTNWGQGCSFSTGDPPDTNFTWIGSQQNAVGRGNNAGGYNSAGNVINKLSCAYDGVTLASGYINGVVQNMAALTPARNDLVTPTFEIGVRNQSNFLPWNSFIRRIAISYQRQTGAWGQ